MSADVPLRDVIGFEVEPTILSRHRVTPPRNLMGDDVIHRCGQGGRFTVESDSARKNTKEINATMSHRHALTLGRYELSHQI
jgi:hypothetical protein